MYDFINSFYIYMYFGFVKPSATVKAKTVDSGVITNVYGYCIGLVRHGPFDILGGGGLGYFGKKIPCSDFD